MSASWATFRPRAPPAHLPPSQPPELDLALARLADGDPSAFDQVFDALWPLLRAYCRKQLQSPADAEDAAQRALLKLLESAPSYDRQRSAAAWALTFAHWECRSELTRRRRRPTATGQALEPIAESTPEDLSTEKERQLLLERALEQLSSDERALLLEDPAERTTPAPARLRKRRQRLVERLRQAVRTLIDPRSNPS